MNIFSEGNFKNFSKEPTILCCCLNVLFHVFFSFFFLSNFKLVVHLFVCTYVYLCVVKKNSCHYQVLLFNQQQQTHTHFFFCFFFFILLDITADYCCCSCRYFYTCFPLNILLKLFVCFHSFICF